LTGRQLVKIGYGVERIGQGCTRQIFAIFPVPAQGIDMFGPVTPEQNMFAFICQQLG
jgi:hypothetical protein